MAGSFKDHFSAHAETYQTYQTYQTYRPDYPQELFEWLAQTTPQHKCAWDCATGNGQAVPGLLTYFDEVIATDASETQIGHARPWPGVQYRVASAEASGLANASVDLITVAQAYHWFDHAAFHREARRVLRPGGTLAIWTYQLFHTTRPAIDALINHYYRNIVGAYWPPERYWAEQGYRGMEFPFYELDAPVFNIQLEWSLEHLLGYLRSWSATQTYIKSKGTDPLLSILQELQQLWGNSTSLSITWPIALRVGRYTV